MKASNPIVNRKYQKNATQFNKDNHVGLKASETKQRPARGGSQVAGYTLGPEESVRAVKGEICTVYPFSSSTVYYGEFSQIYRADFSRPTARSVMFETKNYIFDIEIDYRGRFIVAEGFGRVRIAESNKNIHTLNERVLCYSSRKLLRLNDTRTKLYYISDDMKAIVQVDLVSFKVRLIKVRQLTTFDDQIVTIYVYKSELYGLTINGFTFIFNTVQTKVIFKRKLHDINGSDSLLLARCDDHILIAQSFGSPHNRPSESEFRLHVFSKSFKLLSTTYLSLHATEQETKNAQHTASMASGLLMIPTSEGSPLVSLSFSGSTKPVIIFRITATGQLKEIKSISNKILPSTVTALRYCDGYFFACSRDKKVRRFQLLLN